MKNKNTQPKQKFKQHGYGWDENEQCWFMLNYGYYPKDIKHELVKESEILLKTGIGKEDGETASKQAIPTRGKFSTIEQLWGSKSDRLYFPKQIKQKEEQLISQAVDLIDARFNSLYQKKTLRNRASSKNAAGTEWIIVSKNGGVKKVQKDWIIIFNKICKEKFANEPYKKNSHPFNFRANSQNRVLDNIILAFSNPKFLKGIVYGIMGWGKSYLMFAIQWFVPKFKNKKIIHIISPSISSGQQLLVDHNKLSIKHDINHRERYMICSGDRDEDMRYYGLKQYMVGDSYKELQKMLYIELTNDKKYAIHFNIHSYYEYEKLVWNPVIKKLKKQGIEIEKAAIIADEIDDYCGRKGVGKTSLWYSQMWDLFYGNTGSSKLAPTEKIRLDKSHAYLDSENLDLYVIDEVTAKEATQEGSIVPVEFRFCGQVGPLKDIYSTERYVDLKLPKLGISIPSISTNLLRSIGITLYALQKDKHKHYVYGARTKEAVRALTQRVEIGGKMYESIFELFKKEGWIENDREIFGILRTNNRRKKVENVAKSKKALMVVNPWFFRSMNCLPLSGVNFGYNMSGVGVFAQAGPGRVNRLDPNNPNKKSIVYIDLFDPTKCVAAITAVEQYTNGVTITTQGKITKAKKPKPSGGSNGGKSNLPENTISIEFGEDCPDNIVVIGNKIIKAVEEGDFDKARMIIKDEHPYSKYHPNTLKRKVEKVKSVLELYEKDLPTFKSVEYKGLQMELYKGKPDWDMFGDTNESFVKCIKEKQIKPKDNYWPIVIQRQRFLTINK